MLLNIILIILKNIFFINMSLKMSFEFSKLRSVTNLPFSNNYNDNYNNNHDDYNHYQWLQALQNWQRGISI